MRLTPHGLKILDKKVKADLYRLLEGFRQPDPFVEQAKKESQERQKRLRETDVKAVPLNKLLEAFKD